MTAIGDGMGPKTCYAMLCFPPSLASYAQTHSTRPDFFWRKCLGLCVCMRTHAHACLCASVVCETSLTWEDVHPCSGGSGYLSSAQVINWWVIKQLAPELSKIMNEGPVDVNI